MVVVALAQWTLESLTLGTLAKIWIWGSSSTRINPGLESQAFLHCHDSLGVQVGGRERGEGK
jgi:hypothetical protein